MRITSRVPIALLLPVVLASCTKPATSPATSSPAARDSASAPQDTSPLSEIIVNYDSAAPDVIVLNRRSIPLTEFAAAMKTDWRRLSPPANDRKSDPWSTLKIQFDGKARVEALHRIYDAAREAGARHAELIVPAIHVPDLAPPWRLKIDIVRSVEAREVYAPVDGRELQIVMITARDNGDIRLAGIVGQVPVPPPAFGHILNKYFTARLSATVAAGVEPPMCVLAVDDGLRIKHLASAILACELKWSEGRDPMPRQLLESVRINFSSSELP